MSWEWNDDANRQPMALGHEELAEVITAWPLLSADLRQAILAHVVLHSDAEDSARFKNVRIAATREAPVKAKAVTGKVEQAEQGAKRRRSGNGMNGEAGLY
ncbi:MAG TPA: hypothetical protein EYG03_18990 [Planctomycetes bacterium]|nr:hypothetical protein [Planctomycetota bacterium]